jgi:hypothetical protein
MFGMQYNTRIKLTQSAGTAIARDMGVGNGIYRGGGPTDASTGSSTGRAANCSDRRTTQRGTAAA